LLLFTAAPATAASCEGLARLALPDTTITMAQSVAAGAFTPPLRAGTKPIPVAFCRVTGSIKPTSDSDIGFELWLPIAGWTGRYESVGNGGFAGGIRYDSLIGPLLGGSAVASTNDGHVGPAVGPTGASWALGHREKVIDYGYRAVHLTAQISKKITTAFYGTAPKHAYFVGCSKGGQEGFMEAQRYPDDFDGIVSGAAANQWTDMFSSFSWAAKLNLTNRESYISPDDLKTIGAAVAAACDGADGVTDGLISDPLRCRVQASAIGIAPAPLATYEAIHAGPRLASGRRLYPGHPFGDETIEWGRTITGPNFEHAPVDAEDAMYGDGFFANFVYQNAAWTFHDFDIEKSPRDAEREVGAIMNAKDLKFERFKARGGKIIQYHGWGDAVVTPMGAVSYYTKVAAAQGGSTSAAALSGEELDAKGLAATQEFYRLFLAPGVAHCAGGPGPSAFGQGGGDGDADHDIVVALERWVEKGEAPARLIATKFQDNDRAKPAVMTRPLCAFPAVARYKGAGDTNDAANFVCRADE
jgi:feruloyl esterase